jgi:predicted CXXCH cytochrome family protein
MRITAPFFCILVPAVLAGSPGPAAIAQEKAPAKAPSATPQKLAAGTQEPPAKKHPARPPDEKNTCIGCHGSPDFAALLEGQRKRLFVSPKDLAADIHWQKGLRCQDCHGGDPTADDYGPAHTGRGGLHSIKPVDIPEFCGNCHADIGYMRNYNPAPRVDQLREYWSSGHGQRLKATGDPNVATCVSCHDRPHGSGLDTAKHAVRPVADLQSPVYRTNVAQTCARCHADAKLMADPAYTFRGRPIGHEQYAQWTRSVHAEALLKKGDLSAATCNNCHGNHGAMSPQVGSVANACGICHGKVASLFADTIMKHQFEKLKLPGCAECHGEHEILKPTDKMLGVAGGALCVECHPQQPAQKGQYGATIAGTETAQALRADLDKLARAIEDAKTAMAKAEQLGMPLPGPPSDPNSDLAIHLRKALDSQTNARVLIHGFKLAPVQASIDEGLKVTGEVEEVAAGALQEYDSRRIWLAASLAPILLVIVVLIVYIRSMPPAR